jgi:hypothetical protein
MLTFYQKMHHLSVFAEHVQWFELEGDAFPEQMVICDVMWLHSTEEPSQSSMEWCHKGFPPPKKFKTKLSAGKIVTSVFWDSEGVIHVDFLPHGIKINAQDPPSLQP